MSHRNDIMNFLTAKWTATPIFALDDYMSLDDLPPTASEQLCVLVDFPTASESIATIAVNNTQGWRESGIVQLVIVSPVGGDNAVARQRGEDLRVLLRGRRINATVVESVSTFSAAGNQDGKWLVWISILSFYRDLFQ